MDTLINADCPIESADYFRKLRSPYHSFREILIDPHFRECWFYQVKLYHSSPKILIDPHFRKYWLIRISIIKILIDPHFHQNTDRSTFSIINILIDQYFHAGTFSASLGIQSVPSSRQVPALTRYFGSPWSAPRSFLMAPASEPYIWCNLLGRACWSDVLDEFAWGSYRPCIVNTGPKTRPPESRPHECPLQLTV